MGSERARRVPMAQHFFYRTAMCIFEDLSPTKTVPLFNHAGQRLDERENLMPFVMRCDDWCPEQRGHVRIESGLFADSL